MVIRLLGIDHAKTGEALLSARKKEVEDYYLKEDIVYQEIMKNKQNYRFEIEELKNLKMVYKKDGE